MRCCAHLRFTLLIGWFASAAARDKAVSHYENGGKGVTPEAAFKALKAVIDAHENLLHPRFTALSTCQRLLTS